ncbi:MAG: CBS domain-containing protein [Proteobacteria bacterium]|nr:CBS domain-containing protein [Pseudomonadota bacterium]NIS70841.1 CBS domain-containing protein [Pseudomonadota bacterium]
MKVQDFMNKDVIACTPNEKLTTILNKLRLFRISGMPVSEGRVIKGIISEKDILKKIQGMTNDLCTNLEEAQNQTELVVADVMTRDVVTVTPAENIDTVVNLMMKRKINRIPVVVDGKIVGIVTRGDIISALAESG